MVNVMTGGSGIGVMRMVRVTDEEGARNFGNPHLEESTSSTG